MIHSPEMLRRIEAVTSSLRGVIRSRVDGEAGVIRRIRVVVVPEKDPDRAAAEVRSALLSSLGVEMAIEEIDVTVSDAPARPASAPPPHPEGSSASPAPPSGSGDASGPSGPSGEAEAGRGPGAPAPPASPGDARAEAPGGGRPAGARESAGGEGGRGEPPEQPAALPPPRLRFRAFAVVGGGGEGVELRVRIDADGSAHEGRIRLADLDALEPVALADAALRAVEGHLDSRPADRSGRILLLEPVDVDETEIREGAFAAVTVRALLRDEARVATGFAPVEGGLRETAVRAALDAVVRLIDGRASAAARGSDAPGRPSRPLDPFDVWD